MFKFPPFLTEQWAAAYFQILFSALVFAIGIPFLGLQLVMQEDVRHVVTYRQWKLLIWLVLVLMLYLSSVSFIWFIHPGMPLKEKDKPSQTAASPQGAAATTPPTTPTATPAQSPATPAQSPTQPAVTPAGTAAIGADAPTPTANSGSGDEDDQYHQALAAGIIITVIPVAAIAFGYWLPTNYTRKKVIREFKGDLMREFDKDKALKKETLMKLVYLGEHGNPGIEKNLVLSAFKEVANHVQQGIGEYQYRGLELADMVRSIRTILEEGSKKGNDDNYKRSAALLETVWTNVSGDFSNRDATQAAQALKQIGVTAVREKSEEVALLYIMAAVNCDDSVVFELGVAALEAKRYRPATLALRHGEFQETETVSNLLGLLAHYESLGPSAKKVSDAFIAKNMLKFSPSLERCLEIAQNYHFKAGSFDTADKIMAISAAVAKQKA
jgi:hypothetical protein